MDNVSERVNSNMSVSRQPVGDKAMIFRNTSALRQGEQHIILWGKHHLEAILHTVAAVADVR